MNIKKCLVMGALLASATPATTATTCHKDGIFLGLGAQISSQKVKAKHTDLVEVEDEKDATKFGPQHAKKSRIGFAPVLQAGYVWYVGCTQFRAYVLGEYTFGTHKIKYRGAEGGAADVSDNSKKYQVDKTEGSAKITVKAGPTAGLGLTVGYLVSDNVVLRAGMEIVAASNKTSWDFWDESDAGKVGIAKLEKQKKSGVRVQIRPLVGLEYLIRDGWSVHAEAKIALGGTKLKLTEQMKKATKHDGDDTSASVLGGNVKSLTRTSMSFQVGVSHTF